MCDTKKFASSWKPINSHCTSSHCSHCICSVTLWLHLLRCFQDPRLDTEAAVRLKGSAVWQGFVETIICCQRFLCKSRNSSNMLDWMNSLRTRLTSTFIWWKQKFRHLFYNRVISQSEDAVRPSVSGGLNTWTTTGSLWGAGPTRYRSARSVLLQAHPCAQKAL